ncbi:hypothetical protein BXZ70DRAFT_920948 [Cristinia sonorae]|uniref:BRCT domain-containing protein n=1 Tax=Cristinia sonorae TaxID=1940300 RepID=A0A8K0UWW7_9AGAR|nr:hypothetical protein BXZ70DRAFT_920948 [Cristinia sonorae]
MWVCTGPFDGETTGAVNFQKSKLLKPGKSYALGRKKQPLTVNHKTISQEHLVLTVRGYSEEDASDPDFVPTVEVINKGSKPRKLVRPDENDIIVNPGAAHEMRDGDAFYILTDISITLRWEKVCCYSSLPREQFQIPVKACAENGISFVMTPHPSVTHHLVSSYSLKAAIAASLLSLAHLVKPDWLEALLALGETDDTSTSALERSFSLPRISEHRPEYSPSIPSSLKSISVWEPNESRADLFRNYRFIFVGEKGREASADEKDLVKRGGGEYECFTVSGGQKAFHNILAKGSSKAKKLVLVADEHSLGIAVGKESWMEFVREAADYRLKFVRPEKLVSAVAHVDVSYVDCTFSDSDDNAAVIDRFASPLPEVVPNTLLNEPSYPRTAIASEAAENSSRPKKTLLRRRGAGPSVGVATPTQDEQPTPIQTTEAPAEQITADPDANAAMEPPPPPRRKLVRRARTPAPEPPIIGIDDPSAVLDADTVMSAVTAPDASATAQTQFDLQVPQTPARTRLKRRYGTMQQSSAQDSRSAATQSEASEPAHKKFKDLFDQSDPDKISQSGIEEYKTMFSQKQSYTQTEEDAASGSKPSQLNVVPEEEEESIAPVSQSQPTQQRGQKRKAGDEDVEMDDAENPRHKQRTSGPSGPIMGKPGDKAGSSETTDKPKGKAAKIISAKAERSQGASGGKVDKDEAFLKAVASTKRGKKKEDDFDREFNNLRISKPDLRREEAANEWSVLEDFGDDRDLRGNFMVVLEMEVYKKEPRTDQSVFRRGEGRLDWEGKPDFKKFKKKSTGERPPPIELVVEEEPRFNFGTNLRIAATQGDSIDGKSQNKQRKGRELASDSDSDDAAVPVLKRRPTKPKAAAATQKESAPPSRAASEKPVARPTRGKGKQQALFIESDEEPEVAASAQPASSAQRDNDDSDFEERRPVRKATTRRKPIDDDSDDGLAFKGFGSRRRR